MYPFRLTAPFLLLAALPLFADEPVASSVRLTHPDQPAKVRIFVAQGNIKVTATDAADTVTVHTDAEPEQREEKRSDGLRVLSSGDASFSLVENENVVEISYGKGGGPGVARADFSVLVPRSASVEIENSWGADAHVEGVNGDVEIKNMQGEIRLVDIGGGALVETMNGSIHASFTSVAPAKPLSFASMNGKVELHLPADAKANVRFRTQNGSILTDFDDSALKTRTETRSSPGKQHEAARIASEAAREAARVAQEVASEIREAFSEGGTDDGNRGPRPPRAPRPPSIPSMVGGKVVSGTLNGGGIELQAATMNGDIVVRKRSTN